MQDSTMGRVLRQLDIGVREKMKNGSILAHRPPTNKASIGRKAALGLRHMASV